MSVIPLHWQPLCAKHLYGVIDDRAGSDDLPLLSVSIHHGVVPRDSLTADEARADDLSLYRRCRPGDVVINRMRAFQGGIGIAPEAGIVSPDYLVLRLLDDVEPRFFHHLFRSTWFVGEMTARLRGIGSSDQGNVRTPRINTDDFGEIRVRVPPIEEQREVADFLDAETTRIDALIEKKQRMIDLCDGRQQALVDEALMHYPLEPLKHAVDIVVSNVDKLTTEGQQPIQLCNYTDVPTTVRSRMTLSSCVPQQPTNRSESWACEPDMS